MSAAPRSPAATTKGRRHPLGLGQVTITGGFLAPRQARNGADAIPSGPDQLEKAGNLHNLRLAAGVGVGEAIGPGVADSDGYKWLEAGGRGGGGHPSGDP